MSRITSRTHPDFNLLLWLCGRPPQVPLEGQILNALVVFSALTFFVFAIENIILGIPGVETLIAAGVVFLGLYYILRTKTVSITLFGMIGFVLNLIVLTVGWFANAGIDGSVPAFYATTIIAALTIFRRLSLRLFFASITLLHFCTMVIIQYQHPDLVTPYPSSGIRYIDILFSFGIVVLEITGYVGIIVYNLEQRRQLADKLLLNILPDVIAEKLKFAPDTIIAQEHENASILFADVVNFTPMSAHLTPGKLVEMLNDVFSYFDVLADKYGVEKIKTIGDCYMVAAGVPRDQTHHAHLLTQLALDMRDYVSERKFGEKQLNFRIGINSGPVVAGVIGRKKFIYDLWGDAVNTASRMESQGVGGCIQVTESTFELIKNEFLCEARGTIVVKGKGEMKVWYVLERKS